MTKVDIFSGFLGAGKTTLIKKLISEAFAGEQIVIIENEFGEIGIDGGFLQDAGIQVTEMNSGCICCSLVGDFGRALRQVVDTYHPVRIIIEPSGVGKLSEVAAAVLKNNESELEISGMVTVVDANKCKVYMKNFGEFYNNQIEAASTIVLSRTDSISAEKLAQCTAMIAEKNPTATVITTPWADITGAQILAAIEHTDSLTSYLAELENSLDQFVEEDEDEDEDEDEHEHHHDDDDDDDEHEHHHHDDDDDDNDEHDHEHHHHDDDDDDDEHDHEHHHHDDDDDDDEHDHEHEHEEHSHAHHHHHHHHHHGDGDDDHDADDVFQSWGVETAKKFSEEEIKACLAALDDDEKYGIVLRAKGIVDGTDGWLYFDHVPGEADVRKGGAMITGRLCVIGSELKEAALKTLFGV